MSRVTGCSQSKPRCRGQKELVTDQELAPEGRHFLCVHNGDKRRTPCRSGNPFDHDSHQPKAFPVSGIEDFILSQRFQRSLFVFLWSLLILRRSLPFLCHLLFTTYTEQLSEVCSAYQNNSNLVLGRDEISQVHCDRNGKALCYYSCNKINYQGCPNDSSSYANFSCKKSNLYMEA